MVLTAMKKQVVLVAGLVLVLGVVPSSAIDARLSGSGWDTAIGTTLEVGTYCTCQTIFKIVQPYPPLSTPLATCLQGSN